MSAAPSWMRPRRVRASTRASLAGARRAIAGELNATANDLASMSLPPTSASLEETLSHEFVHELARVCCNRGQGRVVLVRDLVGYFVKGVPPVAELPDPYADIGEREVVAACGVEQHGRLPGTREGNAAR